MAELCGDKQAAAQLQRLEKRKAASVGAVPGGALSKRQLGKQIKKLKKMCATAATAGDMEKAKTFKLKVLELEEQQKTAPDVDAAPADPRANEEGYVADNDPMLMDIMAELGSVALDPAFGGSGPTKDDVIACKRKAVALKNAGDIPGAQAAMQEAKDLEAQIANPSLQVASAAPATAAAPDTKAPRADEENVQRVAGDFQLNPDWIHEPQMLELIVSNASLDTLRTELADSISSALKHGRQAPEAVVAKEQQVSDKLAELQDAVGSGSLSMGSYLAQLDESLHRDRRLVDALYELGRAPDAEAVQARVDLTDQEASAVRGLVTGAEEPQEEEPQPEPEPVPVPAPAPPPRPHVALPEAEPPVPVPAPAQADPAELEALAVEVKRLKGEAIHLKKANDSRGAMAKLKLAKDVETRLASLEYGLELSMLQDPTALPLLFDCSAALEAEKETLEAHVMAACTAVPPTVAPVATSERLQGVLDRLAELQSSMESGQLTMGDWYKQLRVAIERDAKLITALRSIKKNTLADEVATRLALAEGEAAELAEQLPAEADDQQIDGMTAAEAAELEAELAEMEGKPH